MNNNNFTGNIPSEIKNLTNLNKLWLQNNFLSGNIPPEIGDLNKLTSLQLYKNNFSGSIPVWFNNLSVLSNFNVSYNTISEIPDLSGLQNITYFSAKYNNLTFGDLENIPENIFDFYYSPQHEIDVSSENISGQITLTITTDGTGNTFQWYKNENKIAAAVENNYSFLSTETGIYYCKIKNSDFPKLVLTTKAYSVLVD